MGLLKLEPVPLDTNRLYTIDTHHRNHCIAPLTVWSRFKNFLRDSGVSRIIVVNCIHSGGSWLLTAVCRIIPALGWCQRHSWWGVCSAKQLCKGRTVAPNDLSHHSFALISLGTRLSRGASSSLSPPLGHL